MFGGKGGILLIFQNNVHALIVCAGVFVFWGVFLGFFWGGGGGGEGVAEGDKADRGGV